MDVLALAFVAFARSSPAWSRSTSWRSASVWIRVTGSATTASDAAGPSSRRRPSGPRYRPIRVRGPSMTGLIIDGMAVRVSSPVSSAVRTSSAGSGPRSRWRRRAGAARCWSPARSVSGRQSGFRLHRARRARRDARAVGGCIDLGRAPCRTPPSSRRFVGLSGDRGGRAGAGRRSGPIRTGAAHAGLGSGRWTSPRPA